MALDRTARGHRFDFDSRGSVRSEMTHKEFLEKGRPNWPRAPQFFGYGYIYIYRQPQNWGPCLARLWITRRLTPAVSCAYPVKCGFSAK